MPQEKREITNLNEIKDDSSRWLARLSEHPIIEDINGTIRFRETKNSLDYDLNHLAYEYHNGRISRKDHMQFYRDIGYSLSGYWDIFHNELDMIAREQIMKAPIDMIEEEIYDNGNVVQQFKDMAKEIAEYDEENDSLPDLEQVIKLLRFAARIYEAYDEVDKHNDE